MKIIRRPQRSKRERLLKQRFADGNTVIVYDDNFEKAFKIFKRKVKKSGIIQELRNRRYYMTRNQKRRLAKAKAIKRYKRARVVEW